MEILIEIKNKKTKIILLDGKKEIDSVDIIEEYSLSKKLLPEIDRIIKKNNLTTGDIKQIKVKSDQSDSFTTTRIAKSVANAWSLA